MTPRHRPAEHPGHREVAHEGIGPSLPHPPRRARSTPRRSRRPGLLIPTTHHPIMTVRELPGWPPMWVGTSGRPAPRGEVGVLRSVDWRVDLRGTRELRLTIESGDHQWTALYPGGADARAQFD